MPARSDQQKTRFLAQPGQPTEPCEKIASDDGERPDQVRLIDHDQHRTSLASPS
ncbi:hypothetical protein ACIA03_23285 [Nocardioides sp. NPDC051685]|uniref:hypothetical protein n=1 Tax=Nocardioides sp. NPDC051685 TaxID=3364334 RepID=UPI0037A7BFEF